MNDACAESAVLGCLLNASLSVARDLVALLVSEDFTEPRHRAVFDAVRLCVQEGTAPDPVVVLARLREQSEVVMDSASSSAGPFLVGLMQSAPSLGSGNHYAKAVLRDSFRRRVRQAGERLAQAAGSGSVDALLDLMRQEWSALADFNKRPGVAA